MNTLIVIASGPSVRGYNIRGLARRGTVLGVNGAAMYAGADIALTMDRLVAEYCYPIWKVQGVPEIWLRRCTVKSFKPAPDVKLFENSNSKDPVFSYDPLCLNGDNSGMCAMNLMLQMKPERVFLLGFDYSRISEKTCPYWHPAYPWNPLGSTPDGRLKEWAPEFDAVAAAAKERGIAVYNVNHRSRITSFPVITYKQFEDLTK